MYMKCITSRVEIMQFDGRLEAAGWKKNCSSIHSGINTEPGVRTVSPDQKHPALEILEKGHRGTQSEGHAIVTRTVNGR